jgi:uncharacterized protein YeeX (DUF496 family)
MNNKKVVNDNFKSVEFFRNIKDQIAKELYGKSFEEQKKILQKMLKGEIKLNNPLH